MSDFIPAPVDGAEIERSLRQAARERILVLDGAMGTMIQRYKLGEADYRGTRFVDHHQDVKGNNELLQLTRPEVIEQIRKTPDSRRLIVSAWNPGELHAMALAPCHCLFQTHVANGRLSLQLYQRSADIFLGVPFNIASYALLTLMVAQVCDLEPGEFLWTGGDCHLYANHIEQTDLQLSREPLPLPVMKLNPAVKDLLAFRFEDFELVGYQSHPHIKAPVAV